MSANEIRKIFFEGPFVASIAEKACSILHYNSYLFIEIGYFQTNDVRKIFAKKNLKIIKIVKDYQEIDRVLVLKYDSDKKKLA